MALAQHHINAIVREVYDQGYFGHIAERIIERGIELAGNRVFSGITDLVDTAARNFIERGYVSGRTEGALGRKIGIKYGFADPVTEERPEYKRSRVEGKAAKQLFAMSYSGYIQRDDRKAYYTMGKPVSRTTRVIKDLSSHAQKVVERFSNNQANAPADTVNNITGAFSLSAGPVTTYPYPNVAGSIPTGRVMPYYAFDLTSCFNNNSTGGGNYPGVLYRAVWDDTNTLRFIGQPGRDSDDANDRYTWQLERIGTNATTGFDVCGDSSVVDGARFNFSFMGARNCPCTVYVELVRFTDESIAPEVYTYSTIDYATINAGVAVERTTDWDPSQRRQFWTATFKGMIGLNNQLYGDSDSKKGVEVKRLRTIKFQPTSTTEADPNGHVKNLELYVAMNKKINYRWENGDAGVVPNEINNPDEFMVTAGSNVQAPYPKATSSWYLVVRADVNQEFATANGTASNALRNLFPSFDVICRRYRTQIKL